MTSRHEDAASTTSVAVIIPAYNAEAFIGDALTGIAAQTIRPDQIIVVDDGSTDRTAERAIDTASRLGLQLEVISQSNRGPGAARNAALARARTDLVALLDADDVWGPDLITVLRLGFTHPEVVACFGDVDAFDANGMVRSSFLTGKRLMGLPFTNTDSGIRLLDASPLGGLAFGNYIPMSAVLLARQTVESIGGFDETIGTSEDREFVLRLAAEGRFAYTPKVVASIRIHPNSLMRSRGHELTRARNCVRALVRARGALPGLGAAERQTLQTAIDAELHDLLDIASRHGINAYRRERRVMRSLLERAIAVRWRDLARAALTSLGVIRPV